MCKTFYKLTTTSIADFAAIDLPAQDEYVLRRLTKSNTKGPPTDLRTAKGTSSFGKRHNKTHTLCRRCGELIHPLCFGRGQQESPGTPTSVECDFLLRSERFANGLLSPGRRSLHIQKHTCSSCGYPAAKIRQCTPLLPFQTSPSRR